MGTSHTRIARDSPFARTLAQISHFESSGALESDALQTAVRREALSRIAAITHEQLKALEPFHQPAPSPVLEASGLADSLKKRN